MIELMLAVSIVLCLAILVMPKMAPVAGTAQQTRALTECKSISEAMQMYAVLRGGGGSAAATVDLFDYPLVLDHDQVSQLLSPDFLRLVPREDPWGNPYEFYAFDYDADAGPPSLDVYGPEVFVVRSAGANGTFDTSLYRPGTFAPNDPAAEDDVVCAEGEVIRHAGAWSASP